MSETMINLMIIFVAVVCVFGAAWHNCDRENHSARRLAQPGSQREREGKQVMRIGSGASGGCRAEFDGVALWVHRGINERLHAGYKL